MFYTHIVCTEEDLPSGLSLLREAALWLKGKGIDYWQNWLSPPEAHLSWVRSGFQNGEFHFVKEGDALLGMYRLQDEDESFWGKQAQEAGYLHSFTTVRTLTDRGIGFRIMDDVSSMLLDKGVSLLRLDCGTANEGLRRYYEKYGFRKVRDVTAFGNFLTLHEKRLR